MQSPCLSLNEDGMATRNDHDQNKAADEAARTARTVTDEAARVGEQTARAGADIARRGTETARDNLVLAVCAMQRIHAAAQRALFNIHAAAQRALFNMNRQGPAWARGLGCSAFVYH
jgi:hypothetical protein